MSAKCIAQAGRIARMAQQTRVAQTVRVVLGSERDGSILIIVLLILATLSLGTYLFSEQCLMEYKALRSGMNDTQAVQVAESGVDYVAQQLTRGNGSRSLAGELRWNDSQGNVLQATICGWQSPSLSTAARGVYDECGKLNLNAIATDGISEEESRRRLMAIPGMTAVTADSILDWIDEDETPRQYGAESNWYLSNGLAYTPRQGPIESLSELLLIRGVRRELVWGDDTDGSGWIESSESWPAQEDRNTAWSQWLTVESAESQLKGNGSAKIDVNQISMANLYRQVETVAGKEAARFVVALRMNGPLEDESDLRFDSPEVIERRRATAAARAREQTQASQPFDESNQGVVDGLILRTPVFPIQSLADLIDRRVEVRLADEETIMRSPWSLANGPLRSTWEWLDGHFALSDASQLPGRINVNTASQVVLRTIPGLDTNAAKAIAARRPTGRGDIAWLVDDRLLTFSQFRTASRFMTGGGDVFSGVVYGSIQGGERLAAISYLVDATQAEPFVRQRIRRPSLNAQQFVGKP